MITINVLDSIIADRRELHKIPEIGFDLPRTREYVDARVARTAPDEVRKIADGMIYVYRAHKPASRAIAFRSDMDALEISECTNLPFKSTIEGSMHACGHDGHMATLMALADKIGELKRENKLERDVVLVFQPAEESAGGALGLIKAGAFEGLNISEIYGMHVMPHVPAGRIGLREGPVMAMVECLDFVIRGKSCHGAQPHLSNDAVLSMAHFISNAQTLMKRRINAFEPTILSIGKVRAGDVRNIVADWAEMECTTRAFSDETAKLIHQQIDACLKASDIMFGTTSEARLSTRYPAVVNPPELTRTVIALAGDKYLPVEPMTIAEDFSEYQRLFPGVFFFTGIGDEAHDKPLHSPLFDFDERALLTGYEMFEKLLLRRGEEN